MSTEDQIRRALRLFGTPADTLQLENLHGDLPAEVRRNLSWVRGPGVVGLGLAAKQTAGVASAVPALKVYVENKLPSAALTAAEAVPETVTLPSIDAPLVTDVEALGRQRLQTYATRARPLLPGYSIGIANRSTGTLACLARRRGSPDGLFLLSNSHVLARSGVAAAGTPVIQPGPDDGGTEAADTVGLLERSVAFDFAAGTGNLCDAAIARLADGVDALATLPDIGAVAGINPALERGMTVQKSGRTTGHTTAIVKDIDYQTYMSLPKPGGGVGDAGFRSQVLCERYSDGGDSGALVCDAAGRAVGLHWCGSDSASVFSPIAFVLDALDIELVLGR